MTRRVPYLGLVGPSAPALSYRSRNWVLLAPTLPYKTQLKLTKVVKMMVDPGGDLGRDEEESVSGEHQDAVLSLVALQLEQHRNFQQNLEMVN